ncbi:hypothetical protein GE09DRAFT_1135395 [Coniochaeta sp. 2T2.1]|nr:hypothetical protein GE09DRAFT_1135395 [Coniochaeta sp. 2T2.1]
MKLLSRFPSSFPASTGIKLSFCTSSCSFSRHRNPQPSVHVGTHNIRLKSTKTMPTMVQFDDLAAGTVVSNQYATNGIEFTSSPTVVQNPFAPSPSNVLQATNEHFPVEFPYYAIEGKFSQPTHSQIGANLVRSGEPADFAAHLRAFDSSGAEVATAFIQVPAGQNTAYGEAWSSAANMAKFRLETQSRSFSIDNLTFDDDADATRPDFKLVYTGGDVELVAGVDQTLSIRVLRIHGSAGRINMVTDNLSAGVQVVSVVPSPFIGASGQSVSVTLRANTETGIIQGRQLLVEGWPDATAGSQPRTLSIPIYVLKAYDVAVIGIEVTQGIQRFDLPSNPDPMAAASVLYNGVVLAERGITLARVFAAFRDFPAGYMLPPFEIVLHGTVSGTGQALPGSPLKPSFTNFNNTVSNVVTPAIRESGATLFRLPVDWAVGSIDLKAVISLYPSFSTYGLYEKNFANSSFTLERVRFFHVDKFQYDAFEMRIENPNVRRWLMPPWIALDGARNIFPFAADGFPGYDYSNVVDVTDIFNDNESDIDRGSEMVKRMLDQADDWGYEDTNRNFIIGFFSSDAQLQVRGVTTMPFWFPSSIWSHRHRACVVQDDGRPLSAVAHEVSHLAGRPHASPASRDAGGNVVRTGTTPPYDDWAPDQVGLLQGVGVDRRSGQVFYSSRDFPPTDGHSPFFDYMSYAMPVFLNTPGDPGIWVSVRGWDEIFRFFSNPTVPVGDVAAASAEDAASSSAASHKFALVRIIKTSSGQLKLAKVQEVDRTPANQPPASPTPYTVVLHGHGQSQTATTVGTSPATVENIMVEPVGSPGDMVSCIPPMQVYESFIPISAAFATIHDVELHDNSSPSLRALLHVDRPSSAPSLEHVSVHHQGSLHHPTSWSVSFQASHPEQDLPLTAKVDFRLSSGEWKLIYTGPIDRNVPTTTIRDLRPAFFPYNECTAVRVRVSDGWNTTSRLSIEFCCHGIPPRVRIVGPGKCDKLTAGCTIVLHAEAVDDMRGTISNGCWMVDGEVIAHGAIASWRTQEELWGEVKLEFTCEDYRGRQGRGEVTVSVLPRHRGYNVVRY